MLFVSVFPLSVRAQYTLPGDSIDKSIVDDAHIDSIVSNSFSSSFYYSKNVLERNYDFELFNKQRRLRMWSNEIRILGYASFLGIVFGGPMLFPDASLWVLIPTETVIGCGIIIGSNIWATHLRKRADAIQESSISIMKINNKSNLYITHYSVNSGRDLGFGIGYKYNF